MAEYRDCQECGGTGKDLLGYEDEHGNVGFTDTGLPCPFCKGAGEIETNYSPDEAEDE